MAVGSTSVGTTAVQLTVTDTPLNYGVWVKAAGANTQKVAVGFSNAVTVAATAATDGYELGAGQELFVPKTLADNLTDVWVIAGGASQRVTWLGY